MDARSPRGYASHREDREAGGLVYPVVARRSGGLSLGVNLFPEGKRCSFDCPYCEVFPGASGPAFSLEGFRSELEAFVERAAAEEEAGPGLRALGPVRDISLSGNGEPTLSPFLGEALELCAKARRDFPALLGGTRLVVITNSSGFLDPAVADLLARFCRDEALDVWAKLDAGTEAHFAAMGRSRYSLAEVAAGIESFARRAPLTIQSMACLLDGTPPDPDELEARAGLVATMRGRGARFSALQLYTVARPSPEGRCAPLADGALARIGADMARRLPGLPLRVYGEGGELQW